MSMVTTYAIINTKTGDAYVGSTANMASRWKKHLYDLRRRQHHCPAFQGAWDGDGEECFTLFEVEKFETGDRNERADVEIKWIIAIGTYNGMAEVLAERVFGAPFDASRTLHSSEMIARLQSDPDMKRRFTERGKAIADYMRTPDGRAMMSMATKRRWADPEMRKALEKGLINRWSAPDARAEFSAKMTPILQDPKRTKRHSKKIKNIWSDPERSKTYRAARARQWDDPERRKLQSERLKAAWAKRKAAAQS